MKKTKHILCVQFKSKNSAVLYDGSLFVNKRIGTQKLVNIDKEKTHGNLKM